MFGRAAMGVAFLALCAGLADAAPRPRPSGKRSPRRVTSTERPRPAKRATERSTERPSKPTVERTPEAPQRPERPDSISPAREPPREEWRPALAAPRLGGRLSAIATDPWSRDRLWLGTEEGSLLYSDDGGATFVELDPLPLPEQRPGATRGPGAPEPTLDTIDPAFTLSVSPPGAVGVDSLSLDFGSLFLALTPDYVERSISPKYGARIEPTLLDEVVATAEARNPDPIIRIKVCAGAFYGLLVATGRELLGSSDEGATFTRLLSMEGSALIADLDCAPDAPENLAVATSAGLYLSSDGGLTFETGRVSALGSEITAVNFVNSKRLLVGWGEFLMEIVGDDSPSLVDRYPDFDDTDTAPWEDIRWIASTPDGAVWLGTEDGVRLSAGPDAPFRAVGRLVLERERVTQVVVGPDARGGSRVALVTQQRVWSVDAQGEDPVPWFDGFTRRSMRQVAFLPGREGRPPTWWVLTTGELWTTAPSPALLARASDVDALADWARRRAATTPDLASTIQRALELTGLDEASIAALGERSRLSAWVPRVDTQLVYANDQRSLASRFGPIDPTETTERTSTNRAAVVVAATWSFERLLDFGVERSDGRVALYGLRRQIAFAAEDAWHERQQHLDVLATHRGELYERSVLRDRVLALEALLERWTGRPFGGGDSVHQDQERGS